MLGSLDRESNLSPRVQANISTRLRRRSNNPRTAAKLRAAVAGSGICRPKETEITTVLPVNAGSFVTTGDHEPV